MRRLGQGSRVLILAIDIGDPEQLEIEYHFWREVKWLCDSSVNSSVNGR